MNKEQSADDPSVDSFVKNMLNSTISMSYPDAGNWVCIEHTASSQSIRAIGGSAGEAR